MKKLSLLLLVEKVEKVGGSGGSMEQEQVLVVYTQNQEFVRGEELGRIASQELMDLDLSGTQDLSRKLFEIYLQEICGFDSKNLLKHKTNLILSESTFGSRGMLGGEGGN